MKPGGRSMNLCVDLTISLAHYLLLPLITIPATLSTQRERRRSERRYATLRDQNGSILERQTERIEVGQDLILLAGFQPASRTEHLLTAGRWVNNRRSYYHPRGVVLRGQAVRRIRHPNSARWRG